MALPEVMYDSIYPANIPADAQVVAGYIGGKWPTYASGELARRFPKAIRISIAVASRYDAECLDVEPGDATPALAPAWVKRQIARGIWKPIVYCSLSAVPAVLNAMRAAGIERDAWRLWTAHYTGHAHVCGPRNCRCIQADATQWTSHALGRALDQSLLLPSFWKPQPVLASRKPRLTARARARMQTNVCILKRIIAAHPEWPKSRLDGLRGAVRRYLAALGRQK